jgi:conjugal transfer ATP-binding protein TraC
MENAREYPLYLRNYRVFIVYGKKARSFTPRLMDELKQIRNTIRISLSAARIDSLNTTANAFLSLMRELVNFRAEQVTPGSDEWNEVEELNHQVVDPGIDISVTPSYIRLGLPETVVQQPLRDEAGNLREDGATKAISMPASSCRVVNMQLAKNPTRFALWQGADNLQNLRFPDLGIPCPFMLTWTVELEDQYKSQGEALRKNMDLVKRQTQPTPFSSRA